MKSIFISIIFLSVMLSGFNVTAQKQKETIKVWGNCGMCQKKIEQAAKDAGASKASWDAATHELKITFNSRNTSSEKIQQAIAAVGYDTQGYTANQLAYDNLHGCCKYERKSATSNTDNKCCAESNCGGNHADCKEKGCCKEKSCCKS